MPDVFSYGQMDYIDKLNKVVRGTEGFYIGPWASRPAANSVDVGTQIIITDVGSGGRSWWWSDGTNWKPVNGHLTLVNASIESVSYTNTSVAEIAGWSYNIPAGIVNNGAKLRTMVRGYRNVGNTGNWTFGVNYHKTGGNFQAGNYAAMYGTSTTTILVGQALGITEMTSGGMRRSGGWGYAWSGGSTNANATIQATSANNPGPSDPITLCLMGNIPGAAQGNFVDVSVELLV